jgi:hypothetical protein
MLYAIVFTFYIIFVLTIAYAKSKHDNAQFNLRVKENKRDQMDVHIWGSYFVLLPCMLFSVAFWGCTFIAFKLTLVSLAIYFIMFEIILNKLRGKPLLEVGRTWLLDVWVRKIADKYDVEEEKLMMAIKLLILAGCLAI